MQVRKFYISQDNTVEITCPSCGGSNRIPLERFRGRRRLTVRCLCRHTFPISVVVKRAERREVRLRGSYAGISAEGDPWLDMQVLDISRSGIGFAPVEGHGLKEGAGLRIRFFLGDAQGSVVEGTVVASRIDENFIGCQFVGYMQQRHKKALDAFLAV